MSAGSDEVVKLERAIVFVFPAFVGFTEFTLILVGIFQPRVC